jgi:rhamnosyltransferase
MKKDAAAAASIGTRAFFCSNSFAAYRRGTLIDLGGFKRDLILGEDMEYAARALMAGYANLYCAEAAVFHSHDYGLKETFRRYFDIGVFDAQNTWMREKFGLHDSRGRRFVISELRFLAQQKPLAIPRSVSLTVAKWLGYRLGLSHQRIPTTYKQKLSLMRSYWK